MNQLSSYRIFSGFLLVIASLLLVFSIFLIINIYSLWGDLSGFILTSARAVARTNYINGNDRCYEIKPFDNSKAADGNMAFCYYHNDFSSHMMLIPDIMISKCFVNAYNSEIQHLKLKNTDSTSSNVENSVAPKPYPRQPDGH